MLKHSLRERIMDARPEFNITHKMIFFKVHGWNDKHLTTWLDLEKFLKETWGKSYYAYDS